MSVKGLIWKSGLRLGTLGGDVPIIALQSTGADLLITWFTDGVPPGYVFPRLPVISDLAVESSVSATSVVIHLLQAWKGPRGAVVFNWPLNNALFGSCLSKYASLGGEMM